MGSETVGVQQNKTQTANKPLDPLALWHGLQAFRSPSPMHSLCHGYLYTPWPSSEISEQGSKGCSLRSITTHGSAPRAEVQLQVLAYHPKSLTVVEGPRAKPFKPIMLCACHCALCILCVLTCQKICGQEKYENVTSSFQGLLSLPNSGSPEYLNNYASKGLRVIYVFPHPKLGQTMSPSIECIRAKLSLKPLKSKALSPRANPGLRHYGCSTLYS